MRKRKIGKHPDEVPHLTPRAKALKRRELIASIVLGLVIVACIALTIYSRYQR